MAGSDGASIPGSPNINMMYAGAGYSDWEIGDVDVFVHDGVYHLFHLIIPNHDYIAHAVSEDGVTWRRVKNALFVGDPGSWDDDMLWTMHVSHRPGGGFQMHYTGLQLSDRGRTQRVGLAVSDDLMDWRKVEGEGWPLSPDGEIYEDRDGSARGWTSFRDPFYCRFDDEEYLLICGRTTEGPVSRRGCVTVARKRDGVYKLEEPLLFPRVYDDVECPSALELNGRFYLVGSIREDIKVRYWTADSFRGKYRSFHSDVLLPQGNYAARVVRDGKRWLLYHFYYADRQVNAFRVLPPPKEIETDEEGRLVLRSFHRWEEKVIEEIPQSELPAPEGLLNSPDGEQRIERDRWDFSCPTGYEIFAIEKPGPSLIWEGRLTLENLGKCGLVLDCDEEGNGYFFPFDFVNGLVRARRWGFNPGDNRNNFVFGNLQSNLFKTSPENSIHFRLLRYGNYMELAIDGIVALTLIDYVFSGDRMGIYSASSEVSLQDSVIRVLSAPSEEYSSPSVHGSDENSTAYPKVMGAMQGDQAVRDSL